MLARIGESLALSLLVASLAVAQTQSLGAADFTFHHEHVLGTSMQMSVEITDADQARNVEQLALREIDRLDLIFSRYRQDSQFMRWQRGELTMSQLSPELVRVLRRANDWREDTRGAFDTRALAISNLWKERAGTGAEPSSEELQRLVEQLRLPPYVISGDQITSRRDSCAMSLDAIAKGFILDAVADVIRSAYPQAASFSIMIGGDARMFGNRAWNMAVAHPLDASENSPPVARFQLRDSIAMATSGGYRRWFEVAGKKVSHIFDPRTGRAAEAMLSASVVAPTAMDADAAATALNVLGPVEGLALIESKPELACLMVLNSGDIVTSTRWRALTNASEAEDRSASNSTNNLTNNVTDSSNNNAIGALLQPPKSIRLVSLADEKTKDGLHVKFTLARGEGGRYRRPYVAVWLEDKDGFPVKTAVLWLQTDGPGPRWHRDLTRWWADDRLRKLVEDKELIGTISGATRGPGEYEARFDMTDNLGKPLSPGKYTLCLEAAREHGTHHLIREEIDLAANPLAKKELKGGTEFSQASYSYTPVAAKAGSAAR